VRQAEGRTSKAVANSAGFRGKMKDELRNIVFSFLFW
jgi:hypothetical protein